MKKRNLILFIVSMFFAHFIYAKENVDDLEAHNSSFSIGVNVDFYYLSPGVKIGYKINDYIGSHAALNYSFINDSDDVPAEKYHMNKKAWYSLSNYKYKNLLTYIALDLYPLENGLKIFGGVGYMNKKLKHKKNNYDLINSGKFFGLGGVGYEGFFLSEEGLGYEIKLGVQYLDIRLESQAIKKEPNWKIIPLVNFAVTYSF